MRTLSTLDTTSFSKLTTVSIPSAAAATTTTKTTFSTPAIVQKSPWHSPVPYLFGGLAAMLGLIAFALLLLACSYWRLSSNLNNEETGGERDLEEGGGYGKSESTTAAKVMPVFEKKIVVIMAGDVKPTFLATPMSSKASSLIGDGLKKNENFGDGKLNIVEKPKHEVSDDDERARSAEDGNHSQESAAQESPEQNQQ